MQHGGAIGDFRSELPGTADVAIIGAGICGLATALPLARAGLGIVVLERGEPWNDASGANAGTISVQVKRREVVRLTREAVDLWQRMGEDYGVETGFGMPGGIRVATNAREVERLRASVADQRSLGIEVEYLDGSAVHTRAPWLGPCVIAGSYCPQDAYSSPLVTGHAMVLAARRMGVHIAADAAVTAIATDPMGYRLDTVRGAVRARTLVVAAGPWSGEIVAMVGGRLPVQVDVNMLTVTEPGPRILDRVVTHIGGILSLKQYPNGTCVIGGGWQGRGDVAQGTRELDYERFLHNMRVATAVVPGLADLNVVRVWSGYEGVAPDALPVLGRLPGHGRGWVVTCARGAYSQGPALGARMAAMILSGREAEETMSFSPARFVKTEATAHA